REVQIWRLVNNSFYGAQYVTVRSGQTTVIEHGFNGRMLKGHLMTSDPAMQIEWGGRRGFTFSTKPLLPEPPPGENAAEWTRKYSQSPEAKKKQRENHSFVMIVESNGDFRVED